MTLDQAAFADWEREHGKPEMVTVADLGGDRDLTSDIQLAIDDVNRDVSRAEAIRKFRIGAAPFAVSEELTPPSR